MVENKQFRYTDRELELISNTFANNDELIMVVRKFFLQGYLLEAEKIELNKIVQSDALEILRKTLLPELNTDSPLHQNVDMWSNINTKERNPYDIMIDLKARMIVVNYLTQRFEALEKKELITDIKLSDLIYTDEKGTTEPDRAVIDISARNTIVQHIDFQMQQLKIIAGQKKETPEEIKNRLLKDSSK